MLAILLLRRGEVVTAERIVDELWGERPPDTAIKTVQVYVSRLRKVVGDAVLATRGGGYVLEVADEQVDAARFEQLAAKGAAALSSGDAASAAKLLTAALDLWRGPPLSDLAYESFAQREISRLEERRLVAIEDRIEAELGLGRHVALVAELEVLVQEHPTHERLRAQLMLALYRSGRQTDALESYRALQRSLADELGLEPGTELQRLERAILNQDPALAAPASPGARNVLRSRRRGGALIALSGCLLLGAAIAAVVAIDGEDPDLAAANSLAVIDPDSNRLEATLPTGVWPAEVAADGDHVWVANRRDDTVTQIDPRMTTVIATRSPRTSVAGLATGAGAVWVGDARGERLVRLDPVFESAERAIRLTAGPQPFSALVTNPVAANARAVWAGTGHGTLARVDPRTREVVARVSVGNDPVAVATGAGGVWVADELDGTVARIDPDAANAVTAATPVGRGPSAIAVGEDAVWVANTEDDTVSRLDTRSAAVTATVRVGGRPTGVAVGYGAVWVANSLDGTVSRIDPDANRVEATIDVGEAPQGIAVGHDRVWVTVQARATGPETDSEGSTDDVGRVLAEDDTGPTDPALDFDFARQAAICAPLYAYSARPAPGRAPVQPEVAVGEPSITNGGTRYTFRVRPGFRFSPPSNEPLTAAAFARSIERALHPRMGSYATELMSDVVGAKAYTAGRTRRLAGVRARGDRLVIELSRPAGDLVARLSSTFFCPVPPNTPITAKGVDAVPSAGPYYVASHEPGRSLVLRRNPSYDGPRPRGLREFHYRFGVSADRAIEDVAAGRADYFTTDPASTPGISKETFKKLNERFGPGSEAARAGRQLLFTQASLSVHYFAFNATRDLFAGRKLRRAVNYAIDRRALAENTGVGQVGRPTDQYLPPGVLGFADIAAYPLGAPDLKAARRLARGFRGDAVLYTCNLSECTRHAEILRSNLKAIGIDLVARKFPLGEMFRRTEKPGEPFDLAYANWFADYADPANFTHPLDPGGLLDHLFEDPRLDRRLAAAAILTGDARRVAYERLDRHLVEDLALVAPFASGTTSHLLSPRMGCETLHPVYGIDLAALCVDDD